MTVYDFILAWNALGIVIFVVAGICWEETEHICLCGKDFTRLVKWLDKLHSFCKKAEMEEWSNKLPMVLDCVLALGLLVIVWQVLPILAAYQIEWRLRRKIHRKHCLTYQVQRVGGAK